MKKMPVFLLLMISVISVKGQAVKSRNDQESNAQIFSERSGTLIRKEFIPIGKILDTKIQVAIFTDLISGKKTSAVRFEKEGENNVAAI